ncbi:MAG: ATP phosphoribosyltransferase regulatory subunit [Deltaproteobacteria bacterium]|nr:ATP phosphoribosyltransferase regulatory subunit [Deltaproteobacteria bacterium]
MRVSAGLPTGVDALFFENVTCRRRLEESLVQHMEAGGFSEVILPILDDFEPYQKLLQQKNPCGLYRFVDRFGKILVLRADFTPMLARLMAPRLDSLALPLKVFYRGDVFRYREGWAGHSREFFQFGAEILTDGQGQPGRLALRRFLEVVEQTRRPVAVVLGFAGALDELVQIPTAEHSPRSVVEAVQRRERAVARKCGPELLEVVEHGCPSDPSALGETAARKLVSLEALKKECERDFPSVTLEIDLAEFAQEVLDPALQMQPRARTYYDGLMFRAFEATKSVSVGGGGRYDRLFHRLNANVHAAGFGISLDLLVS